MSVSPFYFRLMVLRGAAKEACILKQDSSDAFNVVVCLPFFYAYCYSLSLSSILSRYSM